MSMVSQTDVQALAHTATEPEAFGAFYRRHAERVLRFFAARTNEPEVAADLMAETFALALEKSGLYRERDGPPVAWLFGIARNLLIDSYRRGEVIARARERLNLEPLELDDSDLARIDELSALPSVEQLLAGLASDEAEAVRARIVDERPYEDIASELRCSPAVVRQRVSRGLARLRTTVEVDR